MRIIKDGEEKEYIATCDNCKSDIVYNINDILEEERNSSMCSYNEKYGCHTNRYDYHYIKCPKCLSKIGTHRYNTDNNSKV